MNFNLTLIAQMLAFLAFIWFTAKFVWPYLMRAIEARQKQIADGLAARSLPSSDVTRTVTVPPGSSPSAIPEMSYVSRPVRPRDSALCPSW
jgi:hypothetical protein